MLDNIRVRGADWMETGIIIFDANVKGNWINMFVHCDDRNIVYQFTLEWNEEIDTDIHYKFEYDRTMHMYHVRMDDEMVVGES